MTASHLDTRIDWRNADDESAWIAAAVDAIRNALQRDLDAHERALLLLSGGSTPAPVYRALAQVELDWDRVDVSLVDDRFVPPDAQASNARLVRETLLQGPAAAATFWPLIEARDTDAGGVASSAATGTDQTAIGTTPDAAPDATSTTTALRRAVTRANRHWRDAGWVPAIAVLGMGEDGHTASLFPGSDGLAHALSTRDPVVAIDATGCPGAGVLPHRISLSAAGLASARERLLLLRGIHKRDILANAAAPGDIADLPVRAAFADTLNVLWCE